MSNSATEGFSSDAQYEAQRREKRVQVRLPVDVRGTDRNGTRFNERTISEDVCRQGVALALSRELELGASLEIVILMSHRNPQGQDFTTQGLVRHIEKSAAGPIVGVEFIGPHFHRMFQSEAASPA